MDGRRVAVTGLDGETLGGGGMQQAVGNELVEGLALLEATRELDVGIAPQQRALFHPLGDPVLDGGVVEFLEGVDVAQVLVLHFTQCAERVKGSLRYAGWSRRGNRLLWRGRRRSCWRRLGYSRQCAFQRRHNDRQEGRLDLGCHGVHHERTGEHGRRAPLDDGAAQFSRELRRHFLNLAEIELKVVLLPEALA